MTNARLVNTLREVKKEIWVYVVDDLPKIQNHFENYLEYDIIHTQVRNYLNEMKKEIQRR